MLDLFELDDLGILPLDEENEEDFLRRGNMIYIFSQEVSTGDLKVFFDSYSTEFALLKFRDRKKIIEKEVRYMKKRYGVDLSWVRFLRLYPHAPFIFLRFYYLGGICKNIIFSRKKGLIFMPVIGIVHHSSIRHELIHAARFFCAKGHYKNENFEETVAKNIYYRSLFYLQKERRIHASFIKQTKKKLKKAFGKRHGYVFIRLTPEEVSQHIILNIGNYKDIKDYFLEKSQTSLRHWIICKKLNLL